MLYRRHWGELRPFAGAAELLRCCDEHGLQVVLATSASTAGVRFVAVTCGGTPAAELHESGAVEVYRDPAELRHRFDESPLGQLAKHD